MCFEKRLDKCWADLKIKFDDEAPLNYSGFKYTNVSKWKNIDFDGELSVEANAIWAQYKICEYNSKLLKWISCFLSNRLQWVKVGTSCSYKSNATSGIPQGSILWPTLFAIYINDLPNSLTTQCKMFDDDLKIYNISFNHDIDKWI